MAYFSDEAFDLAMERQDRIDDFTPAADLPVWKRGLLPTATVIELIPVDDPESIVGRVLRGEETS